MNRLFIFILLLSVSNIVTSQIITVIDSSSQKPLEFVSVSSENPREMVSTNSNGQASIAFFKGAEEIHIRLLGFVAVIKSFKQLEESGFMVYMKPAEFSLNQVVISANRWKQNSTEVPQKITSIKPKEVALQNPQTAADLLSISGNVFVQKSQQGGGSPMIRGFATNRLLYTIDGVRMNTAIFRGGNIQNVISLDPFAIENTEILFGPGSVIYGSDAIGGVMSFQTLTPKFSSNQQASISGKANTRYSSANNERTAHFNVGVGWNKWAILSSISANKFDDLRQGTKGPSDYIKPYYVKRVDSVDQVISQKDPLVQNPTAYSQQNFMQKVRFKPNEKWDFQYSFHYSETSSYGRYDRHNRVKNDLPSYAEWSYGPQKWMMNNLRIKRQGHNSMYDELSINLAQQSFEESRIDRDFNKNNRRIRTEEVEAYSVNLDFIKKTDSKHTLFYGAEYILNLVGSQGIEENILSGNLSNGASRYPESDWSSIAIYINDEFSIAEKISLQAGLRYNQYVLNAAFDTSFYPFPFTSSKLNNGALTGSIGAVFRPNGKVVLSTNFGTAFRSPNVDDIGKVFDSEPGSVVIPNPDLEAEYAYNVDFGIAKIFGKSVKIDLTAYYTILHNAMVRRDFQLNGKDSIPYDGELSQVQTLQNAAVANVYGIQAGLEVKFIAGFSFSSNLNYQIGEEELDNGSKSPSRHVAPMFGVSRFSYVNNKLSLQLFVQYQSKREFGDLPFEEQSKTEIYALNSDGNPYSPSWYSIGFKAMYQLNSNFSISSGIENLTNQRYRPYSSGISAAGMNFIMSLNAKF